MKFNTIKIEKEVQDFIQFKLAERLFLLTRTQRDLFNKIYPTVTSENIISAIDLCDRTLQKNDDRIVEFKDPHPGFAGCAIPLPDDIRRIAEQASGTKDVVSNVVHEIKNAAMIAFPESSIEVEANDWSIFLRVHPKNSKYPTHSWRVLSYMLAS